MLDIKFIKARTRTFAPEKVGFIHLTGKSNYIDVTNAWNADVDNASNQKHFDVRTKDGGNLDELKTNVDVAIKASLYYWELHNLNRYAAIGVINDNDDSDIDNVSKVINTGSTRGPLPNGSTDRRTFTKKAFEVLNQL